MPSPTPSCDAGNGDGAQAVGEWCLRLPDFLGLGTQKGGTTTLHQLLRRHPGIFLPPSKELHYFTVHYAEGVSWYASHYAEAPLHCRCGDITPYYLFHPQAPGRIRDLLPNVKLIVLLRDPVERTLSQYFHAVRLGVEPLPLEQALVAEPRRLAGAEQSLAEAGVRHLSHQEHSYLARSRYEQQLARYERLFAPEQLLVLRSEDLFSQPDRIWRRLLVFLELEPVALPDAPPANAGAGEAASVSPQLRGWLREQLDPTYLAMEKIYGIGW